MKCEKKIKIKFNNFDDDDVEKCKKKSITIIAIVYERRKTGSGSYEAK